MGGRVSCGEPGQQKEEGGFEEKEGQGVDHPNLLLLRSVME